ncbi:unnamed protein product [Lactuca virosa]|uniref:Uncharacterized protein n=1 Tax=Lactuca virosa TaxID=75947 RepID=A0AAU9PRU7_9ASTR|nr:unnamed protein product [Lactuca virosa]
MFSILFDPASVVWFHIGMRVLAVADDLTCFKLPDGLLRKCQYQGTIIIRLYGFGSSIVISISVRID